MASFRKLKSGKWQYRVHVDGKEVSKGGFRTKKEAQIEAASIEDKVYNGQTLGDKHKLMRDFVVDYMQADKQNNVRRSTYDAYWSVIECHILPHFGDKKMMKISRQMIKKWMNDYKIAKKEDGSPMYAYGSRLRFASILKGIFHAAYHDYRIISENPMVGLKVPGDQLTLQTADEEEGISFYTLEELNRLLLFLKTYEAPRYKEYKLYYMMCLLQSRTGMRISEMLALTWEDIEDDRLSITKQTSRDRNNKMTISPPKSRAGIRTIKLDADTAKELKRFRLTQNECIIKYKSFVKNEDNIILQQYNGNYLTPSTIRETLVQLCKKAGVEYRGTHAFRHTHAVLLLESGASLKYVASRLGHEKITTTADYLHITEKIEKDELDKFASHISK